MSNVDKTPLSNKCDILAELWLNYKNESEFKDFLEYNDLGLPLAFAMSQGIVESSNQAKLFVEETFANLMWSLTGENVSVTDPEDGSDYHNQPEPWLSQEFDTLDDVFLYFGVDAPNI